MNKSPLWILSTVPGAARQRFVLVRILAGSFMLAGCGRTPEIAGIHVNPNPVSPGGKAVVALSLHYPRDGISYQWWTSTGTCDPPTTQEPRTTYVAPPQSTPVRLKVSMLYKNRILSERETLFQVADVEVSAPPPPDTGTFAIRLTTIPVYDPRGGGDRTNRIAGKVDGITETNATNYWIIIYTKTIDWWVQPRADLPLTTLSASGELDEMIYKGSEYALLLVTKAFKPADAPSPTPVLPSVDGRKVLKEVRVRGVAPQ